MTRKYLVWCVLATLGCLSCSAAHGRSSEQYAGSSPTPDATPASSLEAKPASETADETQTTRVPGYVDLAGAGATQSAHVLFRIEQAGGSSSENPDFYVATYSPKGIRVGIGRLSGSSREARLDVRLPAGEYRVEISRRAEDATRLAGAFNFGEGRWVPPRDASLTVVESNLSVAPGVVVFATLEYDSSGSSRLNVRPGALADVRTDSPGAHPFLKAATLAQLEQKHIVGLVVENGDFEPAGFAATALLKGASIDQELLTAALRERKGQMSWALARVVAHARPPKVGDLLVQWMKGAPENARLPALWALGELGETGAEPIVIQALDSGTPLEKAFAGYALRNFDSATAVEALKRGIQDPTCAEVNELVRIAEAELGGIYRLDPDGWVRVEPLPSWCVRNLSALALGQRNDPGALDALIGLTASSDESLRMDACKGLSRFRDSRSVAALLSRIKDNARVQFLAAAALTSIDTPEARKALQSFASGGADEVTRSLARSHLDKGRQRKGTPAPGKSTKVK